MTKRRRALMMAGDSEPVMEQIELPEGYRQVYRIPFSKSQYTKIFFNNNPKQYTQELVMSFNNIDAWLVYTKGIDDDGRYFIIFLEIPSIIIPGLLSLGTRDHGFASSHNPISYDNKVPKIGFEGGTYKTSVSVIYNIIIDNNELIINNTNFGEYEADYIKHYVYLGGSPEDVADFFYRDMNEGGTIYDGNFSKTTVRSNGTYVERFTQDNLSGSEDGTVGIWPGFDGFIYSYKLTDNGTICHKLIPVIQEVNDIFNREMYGFYDIVQHAFFPRLDYADSVVIYFHSEQGEIFETVTVIYGEQFNAPSHYPIKPEHVFGGWSTDGTVENVVTFPQYATNVIRFYPYYIYASSVWFCVRLHYIDLETNQESYYDQIYTGITGQHAYLVDNEPENQEYDTYVEFSSLSAPGSNNIYENDWLTYTPDVNDPRNIEVGTITDDTVNPILEVWCKYYIPVVFFSSGGYFDDLGETSKNIMVEYGQPVENMPIVNNTYGWTFLGWSIGGEDPNNIVTSITSPTPYMELYANWNREVIANFCIGLHYIDFETNQEGYYVEGHYGTIGQHAYLVDNEPENKGSDTYVEFSSLGVWVNNNIGYTPDVNDPRNIVMGIITGDTVNPILEVWCKYYIPVVFFSSGGYFDDLGETNKFIMVEYGQPVENMPIVNNTYGWTFLGWSIGGEDPNNIVTSITSVAPPSPESYFMDIYANWDKT